VRKDVHDEVVEVQMKMDADEEITFAKSTEEERNYEGKYQLLIIITIIYSHSIAIKSIKERNHFR